MKNILTENLWPDMGQVILLYCHTILRKKSFVIGFVFIPILRILSRSVPSQMLCRIVNSLVALIFTPITSLLLYSVPHLPQVLQV